jgi:hypothetical protein
MQKGNNTAHTLPITGLEDTVIFNQLLPRLVVELEIAFFEVLLREFEKISIFGLHHELYRPIPVDGTDTDNFHSQPPLINVRSSVSDRVLHQTVCHDDFPPTHLLRAGRYDTLPGAC